MCSREDGPRRDAQERDCLPKGPWFKICSERQNNPGLQKQPRREWLSLNRLFWLSKCLLYLDTSSGATRSATAASLAVSSTPQTADSSEDLTPIADKISFHVMRQRFFFFPPSFPVSYPHSPPPHKSPFLCFWRGRINEEMMGQFKAHWAAVRSRRQENHYRQKTLNIKAKPAVSQHSATR